MHPHIQEKALYVAKTLLYITTLTEVQMLISISEHIR